MVKILSEEDIKYILDELNKAKDEIMKIETDKTTIILNHINSVGRLLTN